MNDEFVRKDYHDATMREIKALMLASEARHETLATQIKADNETFKAEFRGEIKAINARIEGVIDTFSVAINDMKDNQNQTLAKWAIVVAILVGVIQIAVSFWLK